MPLFSKRTCAQKISFLTNLDISSQEFSEHKAVKFGRNIILHWDYKLTKKNPILRGTG
jgi:hypothetical protein